MMVLPAKSQNDNEVFSITTLPLTITSTSNKPTSSATITELSADHSDGSKKLEMLFNEKIITSSPRLKLQRQESVESNKTIESAKSTLSKRTGKDKKHEVYV
jgi:hypothetical protein